MPITSNAAPDEKRSPFYIDNETLVYKWEQFILDRDGQVNGVYNAWSFNVKSKVKGKKTWLIDVKKATYSNGFLLFSSKYQNLKEELTFKTIFKDSGCPDFHIKKSKTKGRIVDHPLCTSLVELLQKEINDKSLYSLSFKDSYLTIVLHHRNDSFELAEHLLNFDLK